jgi:hypothetical protein
MQNGTAEPREGRVKWKRLRQGPRRRHGRQDSFHQVGGRAVLFDHTHLSAVAVGPVGFKAWQGALQGDDRWEFDDRYLLAAGSPEGLWIVDKKGRVWLGDGTRWHRKSDAAKEEVQRRLREGRLAWDERRARLLLAGGDKRNDTWEWRPAAGWSQAPAGGLAAGRAALASTPAGVFALVGTHLFLRIGDVWASCLKDEAWEDAHADDVTALLYDPCRGLLLSVSEAVSGGTRIHAWRPDGAQVVDDLPQELHRAILHGAAVGVDPIGDRLLIAQGNEVDEWPLAQLGDARIGLPTPSGPIRAARKRPKKLPPDALRAAVRLVPTNKKVDIADLPVPDEHVFLAWLPASKRLPLGVHRSIAITMHEDVWTQDALDPFSRAFGVTFLDWAPPGPVVRSRDGGVLAKEETFDDPDPRFLEEMDAGPGWDLAHATKIGGFARLVQNASWMDEEADTLVGLGHDRGPRWGRCRKCRKKLVYRVQLSTDLYVIGDCGRAWLYACPDGCDAGVIAESA